MLDEQVVPILVSVGSWLLFAGAIAGGWWVTGQIAEWVMCPVRRLYNRPLTLVTTFLRLVLAYIVATIAATLLHLQTNTIIILLAAAITAVISLSAQNAAGNVISGLVVRSRKLLNEGEQVMVADIRGHVAGMDFFGITLVTPDHESITVPWSLIDSSVIINESRLGLHPLEIFIPIPGSPDLERAYQIIGEVVAVAQTRLTAQWPARIKRSYENSLVAGVRYPYVVWREFGSDSTNFFGYLMTATMDDRLMDQEVSEIKAQLYAALNAAGMAPGQTADNTLVITETVPIRIEGLS